MKTSPPNTLARNLRAFFGEYLPELRGLSRHTLLSYRDTFTLLLRFLAKSRHCDVVNLDLEAISPEAVLTFLNHLERSSQQDLLAQCATGRHSRLLPLLGNSRPGAPRAGAAHFGGAL